jgi:ParB-like chromosome segregation protein Spo0J
MATGNETTGPRLASLVRLIQDSQPKQHHPPDSACPGRGLAKEANRQIEYVQLARLTPCERNARTHSTEQVRKLAESIKRFGFTVPVLVNAENQIVCGHGRVEAAKLLGLGEVPVLRVSHLSVTDQRAYSIADNRLAELARWDHDALAIELQALIDLDFAVDVTGFDIGEIELMLHDQDEDETGDDKTAAKTASSASGPIVSRAGDVWRLGAHQLTCGDAADKAAYAAIDAAIRRWQKSTGLSATLAGSGATFKAIAHKRRKQAPARRASGPGAVAQTVEAA